MKVGIRLTKVKILLSNQLKVIPFDQLIKESLDRLKKKGKQSKSMKILPKASNRN
jgi:hypothetical protein